jgi:hypothetical protein
LFFDIAMPRQKLIEFTPNRIETAIVLDRLRRERPGPRFWGIRLTSMVLRPLLAIAWLLSAVVGAVLASQLSQSPVAVVAGGVAASILFAALWHLFARPWLLRRFEANLIHHLPAAPVSFEMADDGFWVVDKWSALFLAYDAIERVDSQPEAIVVVGRPETYHLIVPRSAFSDAGAMEAMRQRVAALVAERQAALRAS